MLPKIKDNFGNEYLPEAPNVYKVKKLAQEAHEAIRPSSVNRTPESIKEFLSEEQYKLYELIYKRFIASQMTPARYLSVSVDVEVGRYQFLSTGRSELFDGFRRIYKDEDKSDDKDKKILPQTLIGKARRSVGI